MNEPWKCQFHPGESKSIEISTRIDEIYNEPLEIHKDETIFLRTKKILTTFLRGIRNFFDNECINNE